MVVSGFIPRFERVGISGWVTLGVKPVATMQIFDCGHFTPSLSLTTMQAWKIAFDFN
jgi:hypothetical protein